MEGGGIKGLISPTTWLCGIRGIVLFQTGNDTLLSEIFHAGAKTFPVIKGTYPNTRKRKQKELSAYFWMCIILTTKQDDPFGVLTLGCVIFFCKTLKSYMPLLIELKSPFHSFPLLRL